MTEIQYNKPEIIKFFTNFHLKVRYEHAIPEAMDEKYLSQQAL
jgi:hypothetical protein